MAGNRRSKGEGSIYERKDGRWVGQYTLETQSGPKRKAVYGKTRKEVAAKLTKAIAERENGSHFDTANITMSEYLTDWLQDSVRDSVKRQTFESYERVVRLHIVPTIGRVKLQKLTPAQVQKMYRRKLDEGLSPRSVQYIHVILHRALKQALRWGLSHRNVCEAVDAPRPTKTNIQPLTAEQARRLLSVAADDPLEALYTLAITSGMRQGELLGLCWNDIDLKSARLHVRRTMVCLQGRPTFGQPKTDKSRRAIAITSQAVEALTRHRAKQQAVGLYAADGIVFCTSQGTLIPPTNLIRQRFKPLLRRAGLPDIRFHDLRHTAATLLLGKSIHPKIVQEMLGHASIQLTLDTYSHVLPTMQAGAVQAMSDVLSDEKEPGE